MQYDTSMTFENRMLFPFFEINNWFVSLPQYEPVCPSLYKFIYHYMFMFLENDYFETVYESFS